MKMAVRSAGLSLFDSPAPDASEGERLLSLGNFAEAEQFFLRVLEQLGDRPGRRLTHAKVLYALANSRFQQKKYEKAREAALATLEHLDSEKPCVELADAHDLLASTLVELGKKEEATPHLEKSLEAQKRIKPIDHGAIIRRRRKFAGSLEENGKPEEAIDQLEQALAAALRECGPEHQLTGDCEADLGRCLSALEKHKEAAEHLKNALNAHLVAPGPDSDEVAKDYQALASAYQALEELETAVLYYEKALQLRERQLGGSSADYAALLMSFAGAQTMRGRYGAAVELMQQAVGKFEGSHDERLAPALESLGTVYVLSGRVEDAVQSLKKARKIWESQPEVYRDRLDGNTQLFETVSGYMQPRDAAALMSSIRPPEDYVYEQRAGKPARPQPQQQPQQPPQHGHMPLPAPGMHGAPANISLERLAAAAAASGNPIAVGGWPGQGPGNVGVSGGVGPGGLGGTVGEYDAGAYMAGGGQRGYPGVDGFNGSEVAFAGGPGYGGGPGGPGYAGDPGQPPFYRGDPGAEVRMRDGSPGYGDGRPLIPTSIAALQAAEPVPVVPPKALTLAGWDELSFDFIPAS